MAHVSTTVNVGILYFFFHTLHIILHILYNDVIPNNGSHFSNSFDPTEFKALFAKVCLFISRQIKTVFLFDFHRESSTRYM